MFFVPNGDGWDLLYTQLTFLGTGVYFALIVLFHSLSRKTFRFVRYWFIQILAFFFSSDGLRAQCLTPNLQYLWSRLSSSNLWQVSIFLKVSRYCFGPPREFYFPVPAISAEHSPSANWRGARWESSYSTTIEFLRFTKIQIRSSRKHFTTNEKINFYKGLSLFNFGFQ